MRRKAKKVTFTLDEGVLAGVAEAVAKGTAPSRSAFVERALIKELLELRRPARRAAWEEAARDPLFLKDMEEVEEDFKSADAETAKSIG